MISEIALIGVFGFAGNTDTDLQTQVQLAHELTNYELDNEHSSLSGTMQISAVSIKRTG